MMDDKPKFIKILFLLWIIIAILFVFRSAYHVLHYSSSADLDLGGLNNQVFFLFVSPLAFIIFYSCFFILLAYGTLMKKSWTWLVGLMLAAYILLSNINSTVTFCGMIFTTWNETYFDMLSQNLPYVYTYFISPICLSFLAAFVIYLSMKPSVKEYFGKA